MRDILAERDLEPSPGLLSVVSLKWEGACELLFDGADFLYFYSLAMSEKRTYIHMSGQFGIDVDCIHVPVS